MPNDKTLEQLRVNPDKQVLDSHYEVKSDELGVLGLKFDSSHSHGILWLVDIVLYMVFAKGLYVGR